jgi:hypothetical protein
MLKGAGIQQLMLCRIAKAMSSQAAAQLLVSPSATKPTLLLQLLQLSPSAAACSPAQLRLTFVQCILSSAHLNRPPGSTGRCVAVISREL